MATAGRVTLRNVADVSEGTVSWASTTVTQHASRMLTLAANISGEDLGRWPSRSGRCRSCGGLGPPPTGVTVAVRGTAVLAMQELFGGLQLGLGIAIAAIFLLLAGNFQSFRLSFAILLTIPSVIAGVVVALAITGTTLNIQSFMGSITAIGVAVANAILLITFAEHSRVSGESVAGAAVYGASSRLRPILMTTLAMIAGMIPMATGLGEGGQQAAPLGRAVIGGLIGATIATLLVLPAVFAILQREGTPKTASLDPEDPSSRHFHPEDSGEPTDRTADVPVGISGNADVPVGICRDPSDNAVQRQAPIHETLP